MKDGLWTFVSGYLWGMVSTMLAVLMLSSCTEMQLPTEPEPEVVVMLVCETYAGDEWTCTERTYLAGTEPKIPDCIQPWHLPQVSPCKIDRDVRNRGVRR